VATEETSIFAGAGQLNDPGVSGFLGDGGPPNLARFNSPQRLSLDPAGNLLIADSGNHRIRRINAAGDRIDTVAGNGLSNFSGDGNLALEASLPTPVGVTTDGAGNILVSNATAIFRIDKTTGRSNRIAGGTVRGNSTLGMPALDARFNGITNVSVDERGVIYFAEQFNFRVVALTPASLATPAISAVIAPGNFGSTPNLAPGGWIEIYGEKLATTTRAWTNSDFTGLSGPTSLAGTSVRIGGVNAAVQYVSPGQVNAVVPDGILFGNVIVEVIVNKGPANVVTSEAVTKTAVPFAPLLLAPPAFSRDGKQLVVAILPDGAFAGPAGLIPGANFRPARSGDRTVLYGIGFGATSPAFPGGSIANGTNTLPVARLKISGIDTTLDYAGLASGFVGLYQFNFVVPSLPKGDQKIELTIDGIPLTQTLYLTIE
jgi:uncharacterized protein (TIGR03437 family)